MTNVLRLSLMSFLVIAFIGCGTSSDDGKENTAPVASASFSVENQTVTLNASSSSDSDGDIVKYEWYEADTLIGEGKVLSKNDFSKGEHTITLKVTDNDGDVSEKSITFSVANIAPTAKINMVSSIQEAEVLTLDGSDSNDSDGEIVKYEWYDGDTLLGNGETYTTSSLSVGIHTITLKVTDDNSDTGSDEANVTITAKPVDTTPTPTPTPTNNAPVANAGADQSVEEGTSITLNASASSDSDGTIVKYQWYENGTLLHAGSTFTKDDFTVGTHTLTLMVTDDDGATSSDTITITTQDTTSPTASITPEDGNTSVTIDSNITITFSEEMNASTLTSTNVTLTQSGTNITYTQTQSGNTLTLNPNSNLSYNTSYTTTIQNVTDKAGNIITLTTATFTTVSAPVAITPKLLKTGQTTSYTNYDDGYYQKGLARSYTRDDANNIVTDNVTGLQWQDNVEVASNSRNWTDAGTYCEDLTLGGYDDWRLPSINELETIVDYGKMRGSPSGSKGAIDPVFENVGQNNYSRYWSSTTVLDDTSNAWDVYFYYGTDYWDGKASSDYVRCTR